MTSPAAASITNRFVSLQQPRMKPRSTTKANSADDEQAGDEAELLAGDGEDEIGMRVGQHLLHRAFARTAAHRARR